MHNFSETPQRVRRWGKLPSRCNPWNAYYSVYMQHQLTTYNTTMLQNMLWEFTLYPTHLKSLLTCKLKETMVQWNLFVKSDPFLLIKRLRIFLQTVMLGHALRRISYATAETSNKLFAYVSHQPSADMEIVCHTFLTRKKDHAEGLSAVLGKLFKQTFAYTLKRRDKLEEVAEKRGNNRRWAKQQISEGHSTAHARNANRQTGSGETANEPRRQNPAVAPQQGPAPSARTSAEPRSATEPSPSSPTRTYPMNGVSGSSQNQSRAARTVDPSEGRMAPSAGMEEPSSPRREIPSSPTQTNPVSETPPQLPKRNSVKDTTRFLPNQGTVDQRWTNEPCFPTKRESPSSPTRSDPSNVAPPRLPIKRNISDADIGLRSMGRQSEAGGVLGGPSEECRAPRKFSAPPDLFPPPLPPPNGNGRPWKGPSSYMEEVTPTWLDANARDSKSLQAAASALLAGAGDTPPPLPRRRGESVDRRETPSVFQEDVIDLDEDDRLRRTVTAEPRVSLTLEDEDWYIPGVSR